MRLATFNILHGRSVDDGVVDAARLAAAVRELDADVLALQEVDAFQPRSGRLDLTRIAAEAMGAVAWRFVPALVGTPGGVWRPAPAGADSGPAGEPRRGGGERDEVLADADRDATTGGAGQTPAARGSGGRAGAAGHPRDIDEAADTPAYGIALLSRLPLACWRVVRLGVAPVRSPVLVPGTARPVLLADEPRVALIVRLAGPAGGLTIATTHLSFVPGWNGVQLRRLVAALGDQSGAGGAPGATVLLGDLNLPGALPRVLTRWRQLARVPTYPAWSPRVQLDHVLARGGVGVPTSVEAVRLPLSDHRALVVEIPAVAPVA